MNEGLFRRDFLAGGGAAAGMALLQSRAFAQTGSAERVVPWVDQPAPVPAAAAAIKAQTPWEQLDVGSHRTRNSLPSRTTTCRRSMKGIGD